MLNPNTQPMTLERARAIFHLSGKESWSEQLQKTLEDQKEIREQKKELLRAIENPIDSRFVAPEEIKPDRITKTKELRKIYRDQLSVLTSIEQEMLQAETVLMREHQAPLKTVTVPKATNTFKMPAVVLIHPERLAVAERPKVIAFNHASNQEVSQIAHPFKADTDGGQVEESRRNKVSALGANNLAHAPKASLAFIYDHSETSGTTIFTEELKQAGWHVYEVGEDGSLFEATGKFKTERVTFEPGATTEFQKQLSQPLQAAPQCTDLFSMRHALNMYIEAIDERIEKEHSFEERLRTSLAKQTQRQGSCWASLFGKSYSAVDKKDAALKLRDFVDNQIEQLMSGAAPGTVDDLMQQTLPAAKQGDLSDIHQDLTKVLEGLQNHEAIKAAIP